MSSLLKFNGVSMLRSIAFCWSYRQRSSLSIVIVRNHQEEMHALIDILSTLNNYTITDMMLNMHEFIQDQIISNDKVNNAPVK
jgi:hypothetical protein